MQPIKTVVVTIGVALGLSLSDAPIFSSAQAQQNNNQASLLLEVQTLRQEIAELRDMVERQQFQMRQLQRRLESDNTRATGANTSQIGQPRNTRRPSIATSIPPASQTKPNTQPWNDRGTNPEYQPVTRDVGTGGQVPQTYGDAPVADEAANAGYRGASSAQQGVEERVINAPPLGNRATNSYPPVVDRSIGRSQPQVPVTGEGTRTGDLSRPAASSTGRGVYSQDLPSTAPLEGKGQQGFPTNNAPQRYPSQTGGVISIPPATGSAGVPSQGSDGAIVANRVPSVPQAAGDAGQGGGLSEDEFYNQGFELLKQSKYEEAATIFEQQIAAYPQGDLADDAHYWIAEAMHVSRKLDVAKVHLRKIIQEYPQSNRLPDAMLKTAYIEQSQGNQIEARILFQEIVNYHPKSDAAIAAKNQLATEN